MVVVEVGGEEEKLLFRVIFLEDLLDLSVVDVVFQIGVFCFTLRYNKYVYQPSGVCGGCGHLDCGL